MATTNYLDLTGLQVYDGLIKNYVTNADAKSIKTVLLDGNNIKFYKKEGATTSDNADYTVTLPETDLSNLMEKLSGATENNVVTVGTNGAVKDSGTALSDLATKTYVGEQIAATSHLTKEIVGAAPAPASAKENVIYMVKDASATGDDKYAEYMLIGGEVVKIGDTSTDLTDYAKKSDIVTSTTTNGAIDVAGTPVVVKGYATLESDVADLKSKVGSGFGSIQSSDIQALFA